jgi:parvulin-like peptidyl-prolyl isomerase
MTWARRIVVALLGLHLAGCASLAPPAIAPGGAGGLATESRFDNEPQTPAPQARGQLPDPPPPESKLLPAVSPLAPSTPTITVQQATALLDGSKVCVRVRAWVNGRPIFEDELMQALGPSLIGIEQMAEPQRSEKIAELMNVVLEHLIDQECMYQDAVKKLEKFNPKALAKLRHMVEQEFDKRLKKMRDAGLAEDKIKQFSHIAHRILERDMIAMEYARSRISGPVQSLVTLDAVKQYYDTHPEEFTVKDRVEWQDVFIAVGPKHPTIVDARRFAEQLVARCQAPDDFAKLQAYDDGDSKLRGGAGFGQRQGEIQPAALEPHLFALKDGQIGPVVEIGTGVHIFRVLKREYAGVQPMDEKVQRTIRRQLETKIAEREYKQLTREMRARAVWSVVRDLP